MPYKRGSQWIGQVVAMVNGKKKNLSHRSATKREAIEWEERTRKEMQSVPLQTRTVSLHEWATAYLSFAKERFVVKTYEEKRLAFKELFSTVADYSSPASSLKGIAALNMLQETAASRSGNAANKRRKNLRAAWQWGVKFLEMPKDNPFDAVPRFAEVRKERRVPTFEEFWKVFNVSTGSDRTMLLAYLHTGARRDELFRLKWENVNFKDNRILMRWRKNNAGEWREKWLPMSDDLVSALRQQRKVTGLMGNVFMWRTHDGQWLPYQYRQHWLKKLCKRAGVEPFGLHGIRHLFASILAGKNVPLVEIQKMLRHVSIQTTARYIHSLQQGSREAIEALPRLAEIEKPAQNQRGNADRLCTGF